MKPRFFDGSGEGSVEKWRDAMLSVDSGWFMAMAATYAGRVRTPFDKRDVLGKIEAFLSTDEVKRNILGLLDRLDILILGGIIISGPISDSGIKALFIDERALSEISLRLANLEDRLLIYKGGFQDKSLFDINPILRGSLESAVDNAYTLFGASKGAREGGGKPDIEGILLVVASTLLKHPSPLRGDGKIKSKAAASLGALLTDEGSRAAAESVVGAFGRAGLDARLEYEPREVLDTLEALLSNPEIRPAWALAAALGGFGAGEAKILDRLFRGFFERGFEFSKRGLTRFLRSVFYRYGIDENEEDIVDALRSLSLLVESPEGFYCDGARLGENSAGGGAGGERNLVLEGSGVLHLLKRAQNRDMVFLATVADLLSVSETWTYELTRDTVFRAFSAGLSSDAIKARFAEMSAQAVPQALEFSISSWEEEYRAVRVYRGTFMVADPAISAAIEKSGEFSALGSEKVAEGVFYFGNIPMSAIAPALVAIGVDRKAAVRGSRLGAKRDATTLRPLGAGVGEGAYLFEPNDDTILNWDQEAAVFEDSDDRLERGRPNFSPPTERGQLSPQLAVELEEKLARKLIVSERQMSSLERTSQAAPSPSVSLARAMDHAGKLRLIQAALKVETDRLEIRWVREGGHIESAVLRPLRLEKMEADQLLEAEKSGGGEVLTLRVGAMVTVRLVKGSYFGSGKTSR